MHRYNISEQEFTLLQNLAGGKSVSGALEAILNEHELHTETIVNNLQNWFACWLKNGVFSP